MGNKLVSRREAVNIAKALFRQYPDEDRQKLLVRQNAVLQYIAQRRTTNKKCVKCNMLCRGVVPEFVVIQDKPIFDWSQKGLD